MRIKIINGPNINMLGIRDKSVYGDNSYQDLLTLIQNYCITKNINIEIIQSNNEGTIIDEIHDVINSKFDGLIINPGAYTHYSYAIRDALSILKITKVEVHISDIYHRESFRSINVIRDVVDFSIVGKGIEGYLEAIDYLYKR